MEYNKSKKKIDNIIGVLGIISASIIIVLASVITCFAFACIVKGGIRITNGNVGRHFGAEDGWSCLILSLPILFIGVAMLVSCVRLLKSPILPNGELRKKQAARIWMLVLSIITANLPLIILTSIVLCMKDFNNTEIKGNKNILDKVSGILGIVFSSIEIIGALTLCVLSIVCFKGSLDVVEKLIITGETTYQVIHLYGSIYIILGLFVLITATITLIFSSKLVKGISNNKQRIRVWMLVFSILSCNLVMIILTIVNLCLQRNKRVTED